MNGECETKFERGAEIVRPYILLEGRVSKPVDEDLGHGIYLLESCADELWEVNWLLGKAFEVEGEFFASARQFGRAFQMEPTRVAVVHEMLLALLRINESKKAQQIARHYASQDDPLLTFDLALVESTFSDRQGVALEILTSFNWPEKFFTRVSALKFRLRGRSD